MTRLISSRTPAVAASTTSGVMKGISSLQFTE